MDLLKPMLLGLKSLVSALILFALAPSVTAQGVVNGTEPYEMVRTLQSLQSQVAQGNSHALAAQRALLLKMDDDFLLMPIDTWQDPRNARAAVIHLLSGGHPKVIRVLQEMEPAPAIDPRLMDGALAYVEGREQDVAESLKDIDPKTLAPNLGGHVALIKAAVTLRTDPAQALELLAVARLLMPGSLVEEAALRREIFVAGTLDDVEKFQSLSIRYLRRFRDSVYAGDFRRRFALAIDALGFGKSPEKFALLESLIAEFDNDTQRSLYLRLARTALLSGNLGIVEKATREAMPLAMGGTRESELLKLYRAGALIEIEDIKKTRDLLWSINKDLLSASEQKLMAAIFSVVNNVRHFPDPPRNVIGDFEIYLRMEDPQDTNWITPVMGDAESILRSSEKLMNRMGDNNQ
ncbi:chemotaxis protein MotC [Roseibium hamelinense]|uniref:Chemotaxis protein MotC n=1 Tax=Roseibium hamelinense TaxID=150831 RepID=A0A562TGY2_9HYPH|nr:chemotaxis protein [Roseibium hamelinense]MTI45916.1 chemotaxis protein [Roseibium hamelinense]TWI92899.1 chemotaxis protein MotC [Roseibium hamelinense]